MIKKLKISILAVIATALFVAPVMVPALAFAASATQDGLCQGANLQIGSSCDNINAVDTQTKVNDTITWVINIFSIVVGVAAVIMIIVGGLRYIISGGDSGNVTSAKNTILYAIIGLVVVALAQFVVKFVLTKVNPSQ
ncbi:MAG: pilin [Candidatus Saccharibacteria bacterium]